MSAPLIDVNYAPIAESYLTESAAEYANVEKWLPIARQLNDYDRASVYTRRMLHLMEAKFAFSYEQRVRMITEIESLTFDPACPMYLQIRCLQILGKLISRDIPADMLTLDWRRWYDNVRDLHFLAMRGLNFGEDCLSQHRQCWRNAVMKARKYFSSEAPLEIYQTFSPFLQPFDNQGQRALLLICILSPTHQARHIGYDTIVPALFNSLTFIRHQTSCIMAVFQLFERLSKHQTDKIDLMPYLPELYHIFMQMLRLSIGGGNIVSIGSTNNSDFLNEHSGSASEKVGESLARITVYSMHRKPVEGTTQRSALSLVSQFMHVVATYYHPSNTGRWTHPLAEYLASLGLYYAQRRGNEMHGKCTYPKSIFLDPSDNSLVSVLLPVALRSMFSKSSTLVNAAQRCLTHLAFFHPSLIMPAYLEHAYAGLADLNSPQRMLSVMQSFQRITRILFNRKIYPQGASHLDALLWACLPGIDPIDPVKTALTLTFFTIVFTHVPFFDARQSDGLSRSRIDRRDAPVDAVHEKISTRYKPESDAGGVEHEYEDEDMAMDDDDAEDNARSVTFKFEEWSLAFVDALFVVLASVDKYEKTEFADQQSILMLTMSIRAFFGCLSEPIYKSVIAKLVKILLGSHQPNAQKQWGIFVATASHAHPEIFLPAFFEPLFKRTVNNQGELLPLATSELTWNLYLLARSSSFAAGAGPAKHSLLSYRDRIVALYRLTSSHKDRSVRKAGHKLLKNFLSSLSQVYPAEYHPFDSRQWSETEQWNHFNCWFDYEPIEERKNTVIDPMTVWHVPSSEELKAVEEIVNSELETPLKVLADYVDSGVLPVEADSSSSDKTGKGDGPLERALYSVISIVRGAQAVLGDVADDQSSQQTRASEAEFDGSRCPVVTESFHARPVTPVRGLCAALTTESTVRSSILLMVHKLSSRLLSSLSGPASGSASLKSLSSVIKLARYALLFYGTHDLTLTRGTMIADMTVGSMREYRTGFRSTSRPILVAQSYNLYQARLRMSSRKQPYSKLVASVLSNVHALAVNDFGKIRGKAHAILRDTIFTFPHSIDASVSALLGTLRDEKSSAEAIQGSLTMLSVLNYQMLVTRKWRRLDEAVDALFDVKVIDNDRVEVLMMSYFEGLFPCINVMLTEIPQLKLGESHSLTEAQIAQRNDQIKQYSAKTAQLYEALISKLLRHANNHALHWRYQMMAAAMLFALLLPGSLSSELYSQVVQFFARLLHNEVASLHHIGNEAMLHIFAMHARATDERSMSTVSALNNLSDNLSISATSPSSSVTQSGSPLSTTSIESESDWLNTKFYDRLYSGWRDEDNAVCTRYQATGSDRYAVIKSFDPLSSTYGRRSQPKQVRLPDSALAAVRDIVVQNFPTIVDNLVHHHPSLAAGFEGQQQSGRSAGAAEGIANLVIGKLSAPRFPFSALGMRSQAFDSNHMTFVQGLIEVYPTLATDPIVESELKRIISHEGEQDYHCTAAEIITGIIKGIKHATFSVQNAVKTVLLPIISHAITVTSVDGLTHWTAGLRFLYSNSDPRRLAWLTRYFVDAAFHSLPGGQAVPGAGADVTNTLMTVKRFRCLLSIMVEQSYRSNALGSWILDRLWSDGWMTAPLKQVRHEASMLGAISLTGMYKIRMTNVPRGEFELVPSPAILEFLSRMVSALNTAVAEQSKSSQKDDDVNMLSESSDESKYVFDAATSFFYQSVATGHLESRSAVYQALLPYVIRVQNSSDQDLAALAKGAAKLAAWVYLEGSSIQIENGQVMQSTRFDVSAVVESVLKSAVSLLSSSDITWHTRVSTLKFLQVIVPRHSVVLTSGQVKMVEKALLDRLVDPQVEVRDAAALAFISLLSACLAHPTGAVVGFSSTKHVSQHMISVQKRLRKLASTKSNIAARHGGVLGLLAIVACYPYDLPPHLPALLAELATHVNDPAPISTVVRKGFADFNRTHKDEWDSFKLKFTEEELDAVNSVQSAQTYFA